MKIIVPAVIGLLVAVILYPVVREYQYAVYGPVYNSAQVQVSYTWLSDAPGPESSEIVRDPANVGYWMAQGAELEKAPIEIETRYTVLYASPVRDGKYSCERSGNEVKVSGPFFYRINNSSCGKYCDDYSADYWDTDIRHGTVTIHLKTDHSSK